MTTDREIKTWVAMALSMVGTLTAFGVLIGVGLTASLMVGLLAGAAWWAWTIEANFNGGEVDV